MKYIKKAGRRAQKVVGGQKWGGAKEARLCQSRSLKRSGVVGANVLQVVELEFQLAYSDVLGGQFLLQPPQLILLPEEHPQELCGKGGKRVEEHERNGSSQNKERGHWQDEGRDIWF